MRDVAAMIAENTVQMRNTLLVAIDPIIRQMAKTDDIANDVLVDLIPVLDDLVNHIGKTIRNTGVSASKENGISREFIRQSMAAQPSVEDEALEKERLYELNSMELGSAITKRIDYVMKTLSPNAGVVLILHEILHMDYADIADALFKTGGNVRKTYAKGKQKLGEEID
jgi:Sigma-70, region 4